MNILVVDDELFQIQSLRLVLRRWGYGVMEAFNGEHALKLLGCRPKNRIDLIITDYAMPVIDGIELVKAIRAWIEDIPAILMTAYGDKDLAIAALRQGFQGFVEKPVMIDELKKEIDRVISKARSKAEAGKAFNPIPELVHKINNPLMSIMGSAELGLLNIDTPESIKKCLDHILYATQCIKKTNEGLMTRLGRPDRPKVGKIDVKEIVSHCLVMLQDLIRLNHIIVNQSMEGDKVYLWGNEDDFEQMITNLLLNAIDAMEGRPERRLSAGVEIVGRSLRIQIEDTGCGIPHEIMDKIFEPHFTAKKHGNGIGLSVVKGVVDRHRGEIEVESQPEKGTVITVVLPVNNR